jgi:coenzyme F420 hydrogenase subunit beta
MTGRVPAPGDGPRIGDAMQTIDKVIEGGFCIGCGGCAALAPDDFAIEETPLGMLQARALTAPGARARDLSTLCPMSGKGADENALGAERFPNLPSDDPIGRHGFVGLGWVNDGDWRARGSSGGLLSWLAAELLTRGEVDAVIQVSPGAEGGLFSYAVSTTPEDLRRSAKSRYYPVQAADAIAHMQGAPGRFLFIGLPCFVKSVRLIMRNDPAFAAKVPFLFGLVCGHLKSSRFAELLAWQKGIAPDDLASIDFRDKIEGRRASEYGFRATAHDGAQVHAPMHDMLGRDWGQGMMKYEACNWCDDVMAECADIAVGDAWLPGWSDDWRGANVVVARNLALIAILRAAIADGALSFEEVAPNIAAQSQAAGLRDRREGLAHRLATRAASGAWAPKKRVAPAMAPDAWRGRVYDIRQQIGRLSHQAFQDARQAGDFPLFLARMDPVLAACARARRPTRSERVRKRVIRAIVAIFQPGAPR